MSDKVAPMFKYTWVIFAFTYVSALFIYRASECKLSYLPISTPTSNKIHTGYLIFAPYFVIDVTYNIWYTSLLYVYYLASYVRPSEWIVYVQLDIMYRSCLIIQITIKKQVLRYIILLINKSSSSRMGQVV